MLLLFFFKHVPFAQVTSGGAVPIPELFNCLSSRVAESLRNEKLMAAEEKALVRFEVHYFLIVRCDVYALCF